MRDTRLESQQVHESVAVALKVQREVSWINGKLARQHTVEHFQQIDEIHRVITADKIVDE